MMMIVRNYEEKEEEALSIHKSQSLTATDDALLSSKSSTSISSKLSVIIPTTSSPNNLSPAWTSTQC